MCKFGKSGNRFYKKYTECKDCKSKRSLKRYYDNEDKLSKQQKLYYEKNRDKLLQKQTERYIYLTEILRNYVEPEKGWMVVFDRRGQIPHDVYDYSFAEMFNLYRKIENPEMRELAKNFSDRQIIPKETRTKAKCK